MDQRRTDCQPWQGSHDHIGVLIDRESEDVGVGKKGAEGRFFGSGEVELLRESSGKFKSLKYWIGGGKFNTQWDEWGKFRGLMLAVGFEPG